jgi:antitoxin VapB
MIDTKEPPMPARVKARVFKNGRSQAVRIPAEYRFTTDEVFIERDPATGALMLSEKPLPPSLDEIFRELDAAGAADFELERNLSAPVEREWM